MLRWEQPLGDAVSVGAGAGQGQQFPQVLLGDVGGQDVFAGPAEVDQGVPHPGEATFGEVLAVTGKQTAYVPLAVALAATPCAQLGGNPAADLVESLVGQLYHMKMIDNDGGLR